MSTIDGSGLAFVPDPPPRSLPLDPPTIRLLARAENALGHLNGTTGRLVNPFLVGSPLLHIEAIVSSRIEGTVTTPEELALFEADARVAADPRRAEDTREVANYIEAMRYGLRRIQKLPLSLRLIQELHRKLLTGVRGDRDRPGEWRESQNWIARPGESLAQARFVPPPVHEMKRALEDFERYLHLPEDPHEDDVPLLVQLAIVHYQFEAIHPFRDGNGRIGRLLIPLLLCSRARLDEPLLYLSAYFERHRQDYYDLLLHVSQKGDWTSWIRFFLLGVEESCREAVARAEALLDLRRAYHQRFQSARSSALLLKLIDELFRRPSITIGQAAELLDVTPAAASANIKKLLEAGILSERTGRKRDQLFVAGEIVAFVERHAEAPRHERADARPRTVPSIR